MDSFFSEMVVQTIIFALLLIAAYYVALQQVIGTKAGSIGEWQELLHGLVFVLPSEKVKSDPSDGTARVLPPLSQAEQAKFLTFIECHKLVRDAERRVFVMQQTGKFVAGCLLLAIVGAFLLKAPLLFGLKAFDAGSIAFDSAYVAAATILFVALFSVPHGVGWNKLNTVSKSFS